MHILFAIALWVAAVLAVLFVLLRYLEDRPLGILILLGAVFAVLGGLLVLGHPVQVTQILNQILP